MPRDNQSDLEANNEPGWEQDKQPNPKHTCNNFPGTNIKVKENAPNLDELESSIGNQQILVHNYNSKRLLYLDVINILIVVIVFVHCSIMTGSPDYTNWPPKIVDCTYCFTLTGAIVTGPEFTSFTNLFFLPVEYLQQDHSRQKQ